MASYLTSGAHKAITSQIVPGIPRGLLEESHSSVLMDDFVGEKMREKCHLALSYRLKMSNVQLMGAT